MWIKLLFILFFGHQGNLSLQCYNNKYFVRESIITKVSDNLFSEKILYKQQVIMPVAVIYYFI